MAPFCPADRLQVPQDMDSDEEVEMQMRLHRLMEEQQSSDGATAGPGMGAAGMFSAGPALPQHLFGGQPTPPRHSARPGAVPGVVPEADLEDGAEGALEEDSPDIAPEGAWGRCQACWTDWAGRCEPHTRELRGVALIVLLAVVLVSMSRDAFSFILFSGLFILGISVIARLYMITRRRQQVSRPRPSCTCLLYA